MGVKKVLLVSAGLVHPPYRGRSLLKQTLTAVPGYAFDEVASLAEAAARSMTEYAALVLYYHHMNDALTESEMAAFRGFVEDGGGVLAVHSATASYKRTPAYFQILGGRFVGHGPVQPIEVRPVAAGDEVFAGIPPFIIKDELYLHELQPDIRVHFDALHESKREPMVWTREQGRGRVCYLCPGHRSASMEHGAVQEIVRRGLRWVAGEV
jgi:type 1 glutamine amidotransferase